MNLPADEIQPVRKHSLTYSSSKSPSDGSFTGMFLELFFFIGAGIWALLHLEQNRVFLHPKAMSTVDCQHKIANSQSSSGDQFAIVIVNVNLTLAFSHHDYFGSSNYLSDQFLVQMPFDFSSGRIDYKTQLKIEFIGS